jgi:uncharacterized repeat protein (TIGR01451 family)
MRGKRVALTAGVALVLVATVPRVWASAERVPRLTVSLAANPTTTTTGERVTFTATVTNSGGVAASPVLTQTLPKEYVFQSASTSSGTACTNAANAITCPLGANMLPSSAVIATIVAIPVDPGTLTSTAKLDTPTLGAVTNTDQAPVQISTTITGTMLRCFGWIPTIFGTDGNDEIDGTPGDDVIVGLGGDDTIDGGGGNDKICGGDGNDYLDGGSGDDDISGGPGDDVVIGGAGKNIVDGDAGKDVLVCKTGKDECNGGAGLDTFVSVP